MKLSKNEIKMIYGDSMTIVIICYTKHEHIITTHIIQKCISIWLLLIQFQRTINTKAI